MKKLLILMAGLLFAITGNVGAMQRQLGSGATITSVTEFEQEISRTKMLKDLTTVIVFSTTWCKPCQKLKPIIEELIAERIKDVKFLYIDGDNKQLKALVDKYAPEGFPTIRIFKDGKPVAEGGLDTKEKLRAFIQKHALQSNVPAGYMLQPVQGSTPAVQPIINQPVNALRPPQALKPQSSVSVSSQKHKTGKYRYESEEESSSGGESYSSEGESEEYSSSDEF